MDQSTDSKSVKPRNKKIFEKKLEDVYSDALLTHVLEIPMNVVGSGIKDKLEKKLRATIEGKCISEGYIKPNSIKVLTYSSGKIYDGNKIHFETIKDNNYLKNGHKLGKLDILFKKIEKND